MKKGIPGFLVGAAWLAATAAAMAANVGVVDMERLIKIHPRTASDRQALEQYVEDFETEHEERLEVLRKMSETFEELRKAAEDIGLSETVLQEKRRLAQMKFDEMRRAERDLREMATLRQRELTGQELRMRQRVVADIRQIVESVAAERTMTLVLDSTGPGAAGYSPVLHFEKTMDITEAVIGQLVKTPKGE